ncbi:hypothetical protein P4V39_01100 [Brevibacillus borstelensis]|uniref:DUF6731 family protein n=1 Tax=Brevibacillus borstelensis TaxID=45462 RepID=UPI002E1ECE3F|nr:hypothetical protein [Brevibacillus borstelensis]
MAVKKRRVRVAFDFYRVDESKANKSLEDIFKGMLGASDPQKTTTVFGEDVRVEELFHDPGTKIWSGSIVKLREMEKIPIYKYSGGKKEIPLTDDEYVGEETSFIYKPSMKVFVLQYNKYGVSSNGVELYLQNIGQTAQLYLNPVVLEDEYKKLLKMKVVNSIEINLALPDDVFLEDQVAGWAFGDVRKLREKLGAMKLNLLLTVDDTRNDSMDLTNSIKLIREITESKRASKLRAKVRADEGLKQETLDFLKGRMRVEYFRSIEKGKTMTPTAVQGLALDAFNTKRSELQKLFKEVTV